MSEVYCYYPTDSSKQGDGSYHTSYPTTAYKRDFVTPPFQLHQAIPYPRFPTFPVCPNLSHVHPATSPRPPRSPPRPGIVIALQRQFPTKLNTQHISASSGQRPRSRPGFSCAWAKAGGCPEAGGSPRCRAETRSRPCPRRRPNPYCNPSRSCHHSLGGAEAVFKHCRRLWHPVDNPCYDAFASRRGEPAHIPRVLPQLCNMNLHD